MRKNKSTWNDFRREIFNLTAAILGAKGRLLCGAKVNMKVLEKFSEIADNIDGIVEELIAENDKCVARRRRLEAEPRLPVPCPEGGNHRWQSVCQKCGMRISFNLDIPECL